MTAETFFQLFNQYGLILVCAVVFCEYMNLPGFPAGVIMPCVGVLIGGFDFTSLKIVLHKAVMEGAEVVKPAVTLNYGNFIQETVNFLIIAFCIFLVIKGLAKVHKKKEEAPAAPAAPAPKPDDVVLLEEIRDLLKNHK